MYSREWIQVSTLTRRRKSIEENQWTCCGTEKKGISTFVLFASFFYVLPSQIKFNLT